MPLRIDVVTIFPDLFPGPLAASIPGRALERGLATLTAHDLREWGLGRHRSVDDSPYGGGAGMVMRVEPIAGALDALAGPDTTRILLDPGGRRFDQALAANLAGLSHLIFVCPRYEGVDERVRGMVDLELSVGDYVVSGGELPAMVVIDAVLRLLPGAIDEASPVDESFSDGLLEYPQFTRPPEFRGERVPDILVSGDHGAVAKWRTEQSVERTRRSRPDLLDIPFVLDQLGLSRDQLVAAVSALNEVLNGPGAIDGWEFHARMGVTRDEARQLLRRLSSALESESPWRSRKA